MRSNVTIKDVAKAANVSITTVSLVLNNKANNISKETIDTVLRVCKELHFEKNFMASSLKSKVSMTVGLILPEIDNNYYSRIASKIDELLSEKGYILLTALSNNDFEREKALYAQMINRRVDYLLILPSSTSLKKEHAKELQEALESLTVKYVILDRKTKLKNHSEVVNDDFYGGFTATEYLINKGYRHIACITGPKDVSSSEDRLQGYKQALEKHHIPFKSSLIYEGDYSFNRAKECSKEIIKNNDIDAVFAFNDMSAYAIYDVCEKTGKKVGQDISIIGFDDNAFSSLISPSLTTIRQDIDLICSTALENLFSKEKETKVIKVLPTLVERKSVCVK